MKSTASKNQRRKKPRRSNLWKWAAGLGAIALVVYGMSQMSSVAYTDRDIRAVNFSGLDAKDKTRALEAANRARCTCGCGMTLAQCVATDSTCPLREGNIERIQRMVREAGESRPSS